MWNDGYPGIDTSIQTSLDHCDITIQAAGSNCGSISVTLNPSNISWTDDSEYSADYITQLNSWLADPNINQILQ